MINEQTIEEEVNTPKHYRSHESNIEAIEVTRYVNFNIGNCWKYLMRYRDKQTPKKDIMKAVWYIKDFTKHFIDYSNECIYHHNVNEEVINKMIKVEEFEPNEIIKAMFSQLIMIITLNKVIDRKAFDLCVYELEEFAKTLN